MKKFFNTIKNKANAAVISAKTAIASKKGQRYGATGVKFPTAFVIGALLLAGLYALFNSTIMPTVTQKITGLFNYNG